MRGRLRFELFDAGLQLGIRLVELTHAVLELPDRPRHGLSGEKLGDVLLAVAVPSRYVEQNGLFGTSLVAGWKQTGD